MNARIFTQGGSANSCSCKYVLGLKRRRYTDNPERPAFASAAPVPRLTSTTFQHTTLGKLSADTVILTLAITCTFRPEAQLPVIRHLYQNRAGCTYYSSAGPAMNPSP